MRKHRVVRSVAVLLVVLAVAASAYAGWSGVRARGDFQVLENDSSGAVVRAWVINTSSRSQQALVNVAAIATDGSHVQGFDTVFVPARTSRPVDVVIDSEIVTVTHVIAR